ncbi:hypothetical protein BDF19DRAFT_445263 [Syncephalis fuscata]|nr:hypothetical protein BDF19DRAFT_445263 [Syncephalis fuscata]
MDAFVAQQLALISIDDEAVCEYVARLVEDGDIEEEERREVVSEFLSASTEEPVEAVVEALFAEWRQRIAKVDEQADAARQQAFLEAREREKKELAMDKQEKQNTDSNNERVRRNQTLARYGYGEELIEQIDDEDEATAKAAAVTAAMLQSGKRSKKQSRGANAAGKQQLLIYTNGCY